MSERRVYYLTTLAVAKVT